MTMGCGDACPLVPGKRYEDWELEDPTGKSLDQIRPIREAVRGRVDALLGELLPATSPSDAYRSGSTGAGSPPSARTTRGVHRRHRAWSPMSTRKRHCRRSSGRQFVPRWCVRRHADGSSSALPSSTARCRKSIAPHYDRPLSRLKIIVRGGNRLSPKSRPATANCSTSFPLGSTVRACVAGAPRGVVLVRPRTGSCGGTSC